MDPSVSVSASVRKLGAGPKARLTSLRVAFFTVAILAQGTHRAVATSQAFSYLPRLVLVVDVALVASVAVRAERGGACGAALRSGRNTNPRLLSRSAGGPQEWGSPGGSGPEASIIFS